VSFKDILKLYEAAKIPQIPLQRGGYQALEKA
jgi:hypothetical protein